MLRHAELMGDPVTRDEALSCGLSPVVFCCSYCNWEASATPAAIGSYIVSNGIAVAGPIGPPGSPIAVVA